MRLRYEKKYSAGVITVIMEVADFTAEESAALRAVGIPNIIFKKTYAKTNTAVDISVSILDLKDLRTEFRMNYPTILIDYTDPDAFITDVKDILNAEKEKLVRMYREYLEGKQPEEDFGHPYCSKADGHIHIFSGEELTDEAIGRMEDGEIFALVEDDEE